jgi:CBS domain-containing protein
MTVQDLMTSAPVTCTPDTTAAAAAHLMLEADCGILPIVDDGELIGVVTDRDLYVALATRNVLAGVLRVGAVARRQVVTCKPTDDVHLALRIMKEARVRRLPVIGPYRTVAGVVSMNDIVLAAAGQAEITDAEIVETLRGICGHRHTPVARTA